MRANKCNITFSTKCQVNKGRDLRRKLTAGLTCTDHEFSEGIILEGLGEGGPVQLLPHLLHHVEEDGGEQDASTET